MIRTKWYKLHVTTVSLLEAADFDGPTEYVEIFVVKWKKETSPSSRGLYHSTLDLSTEHCIILKLLKDFKSRLCGSLAIL